MRSQIVVAKSSIFDQRVDAIVNPANSRMMHTGGLAAVIARAAGPALVLQSGLRAGTSEMVAATPDEPIPVGSAITTTAGKLPFKGVIHAVGPRYDGDQERCADKLALAHYSAIREASLAGWHSIAFPAVSCGIFGYPVELAAPVAVKSARDAARMYGVKRVVFCLTDDEHFRAFSRAARWWRR